MERYLGQPEGLDDPSLVAERVLDEARRTFQGLDATFLEHIVREVVADIWSEPVRVTSFVPLLAMRQVREMLEAGAVPPVEPVLQSA